MLQVWWDMHGESTDMEMKMRLDEQAHTHTASTSRQGPKAL